MERRTWTPSERAEALAVYAEVGLAGAHQATGVPKATLHRWAKAAGLDTVGATERSIERNTVAARAAAATRAYVSEEFRTEMVAKLAEIARQAAERELAVLDDSDLRSVVGARTRAIHDLQLLTGAATGRTETVERDATIDAELARVIELRRSA